MNINKDHVNVPSHVVVPMKENLITKNHLLSASKIYMVK